LSVLEILEGEGGVKLSVIVEAFSVRSVDSSQWGTYYVCIGAEIEDETCDDAEGCYCCKGISHFLRGLLF
jgi:hypothetical protein